MERNFKNIDDFFNANFNDLFDGFFGFNTKNSYGRKSVNKFETWEPLGDIYEDSKNFKFRIDLPGVEKENIKITFTDNNLKISGFRLPEKEEENCIYHYVERFYGKFEKEFALPENIVKENITAEFDKGQLIITLPKSKNAYKNNSIDIKIK